MNSTAPSPAAAVSLPGVLRGLDGRDYAAYQALVGSYRFEAFELHVDRVPKDPYAPSGTGSFRVRTAWTATGLPETLLGTPARRIAVGDFLVRRFARACEAHGGGRRGTGNSGIIAVAEPGPAILPRSAVLVEGGDVEVRCFLGLPADGRSIDARLAERMLLGELPPIVSGALLAPAIGAAEAAHHVHVAEDAIELRAALPSLGLVAFLADGAVLPRAGGASQAPLRREAAVPLSAPESLRVTVELPHAGLVTGLGIPRGVTVIVGGGFHGKSTLLSAIAEGVYDHSAGDGRERCVTGELAVKVRAAPGRPVAGVDISPYVGPLPGGPTTDSFFTDNASGSTSQAASLAEALEMGAELLLLDEDTCATNLMFRDHRMQLLVTPEDEPLVPFLDHVRDLSEGGISTILVAGATGDYLDVADLVIQMRGFQPLDVTASARRIASECPGRRSVATPAASRLCPRRRPDPSDLDPTGEHDTPRVHAPFVQRLLFGTREIDLSDVEQLVERAQTQAIGLALARLPVYLDGRRSLPEAISALIRELGEAGLDLLDRHLAGDAAAFRPFELAAAVNRLRGLHVDVDLPPSDIPHPDAREHV